MGQAAGQGSHRFHALGMEQLVVQLHRAGHVVDAQGDFAPVPAEHREQVGAVIHHAPVLALVGLGLEIHARIGLHLEYVLKGVGDEAVLRNLFPENRAQGILFGYPEEFLGLAVPGGDGSQQIHADDGRGHGFDEGSQLILEVADMFGELGLVQQGTGVAAHVLEQIALLARPALIAVDALHAEQGLAAQGGFDGKGHGGPAVHPAGQVELVFHGGAELLFQGSELGVWNDGDGFGPFAVGGTARMLDGLEEELHEGGRGRGVHEIRQGQARNAAVDRLLGYGPGGLGPVADQDIGDPIGLEFDQKLFHDHVHQVVIVQAHGDALDEVHQPLLVGKVEGVFEVRDFQLGEHVHKGRQLFAQALVLRLQLPATGLDVFFQLACH